MVSRLDCGTDSLIDVSSRFEQAMRLMRRHDPQQQEEDGLPCCETTPPNTSTNS